MFEYLYKRNRILERQSEVQGETINYAEQNKCSSEDFEKLTKGEKDLWEAAARAQVLRLRQPHIARILIDLMRKDPSITYPGLANQIDHW